MASQYRYSPHGRGKKKMKEIKATEEMQKLVPTSRICINEEWDTVYIFNGKDRPVQGSIAGDSFITVSELKQKLITLFKRSKEDDIVEWLRLLSNLLSELLQKDPDLEDEDDQEKKIKYYIQKYTKDIPPVESVLIGEKPMFLQVIDGKAVLSEEIQLPDSNISLRPLDNVSYLSKAYPFDDEPEINSYIKRAQNETLDTLYDQVKLIWKKYKDADDYHIVICAADTIFTYFQDKLGMTHYLLFVGDNNVGKTNNLTVFQWLGYRPLCDISITPANIYRFFGGVEEGQGIILEDEIDDIDQQPEKMKLYKAGYKTGTKVSRNDDTGSGRRSQGYWTYGFKAFTSEKQPDSINAKGFNERVFVIKCYAGTPEYDISEVVDLSGDETFKSLLDELVDIRKLLLVYRLLHWNDPIPDKKGLNIKRRDKQLCKPLIRLFQYASADTLDEIMESLTKLLKEKNERKANTIEAKLHGVVISLAEKIERTSLDNDEVILTIKEIRDRFSEEVNGTQSSKNSRSIETSEYGLISHADIGSILRDRFGGEDIRDSKDRKLIFSRTKLKRLAMNYSIIDKIKIEPDTNRSTNDIGDINDVSADNGTNSETNRTIENDNNCNIHSKNIQETGKDIGNITDQTSTKESEHSTTTSFTTSTSPASTTDNNHRTPPTEEPKLRDLPEMPKEIEDGLPTTSEEELESLQESHPTKPITPAEVEDFFNSDMPLGGHGIEESPCHPIIATRPGEIPPDTVYYCKLHPDMIPSTFLHAIELHCRQIEPDIHKAEILRIIGESA